MAFSGFAIWFEIGIPDAHLRHDVSVAYARGERSCHIMRVLWFVHGDATGIAGGPKTVAIKSKTGQRDLSQCLTTLG
jgi:hypothetical protein